VITFIWRVFQIFRAFRQPDSLRGFARRFIVSDLDIFAARNLASQRAINASFAPVDQHVGGGGGGGEAGKEGRTPEESRILQKALALIRGLSAAIYARRRALLKFPGPPSTRPIKGKLHCHTRSVYRGERRREEIKPEWKRSAARSPP